MIIVGRGGQINQSTPGRLPIGFVYVQFPNQLDPQTAFGGQWEDITSDYAGLFFRAEGLHDPDRGSLPFSDTSVIVQDDSIQKHYHRLQDDQGQNYTGRIVDGGGVQGGIDHRTDLSSTARELQARNIISGRWSTETRPINTAIRIWKKVGD
jgi:hypothetical protein